MKIIETDENGYVFVKTTKENIDLSKAYQNYIRNNFKSSMRQIYFEDNDLFGKASEIVIAEYTNYTTDLKCLVSITLNGGDDFDLLINNTYKGEVKSIRYDKGKPNKDWNMSIRKDQMEKMFKKGVDFIVFVGYHPNYDNYYESTFALYGLISLKKMKKMIEEGKANLVKTMQKYTDNNGKEVIKEIESYSFKFENFTDITKISEIKQL